MARLRRPAPTLRAVAPAIERPTTIDANRKAASPWRGLYSTARWARTRLATFERDEFTCQDPECGRTFADSRDLVCDHVEPHRGDVAAFWRGPFQTLCRWCHASRKQAVEHAAARRGARLGG